MAIEDPGERLMLGPFQVGPMIGQGGMGQVFEGMHVDQRVPVAIKVLTGRLANDKEYRASFRAEVQAVAGLDHPGIVMVFDMGLVDERAERLSQGKLVCGAPYLVMELVGGGSLERAWRGLPWGSLRSVLFAMLDALSHAHARGVIHRDIKPANILMDAPTDARPGVKLTDFGIAHAVNARVRHGEVEDAFGTPEYMSPEQFMGRFRDYGPWTDLYSLGCLAWQLAAGRLPFVVQQGQDKIKVLSEAHLYGEVPELVARYPVPEGLDGWIRRMTARSPWDRFERAADAARALLEVERAWERPAEVGPLEPLSGEICATLCFLGGAPARSAALLSSAALPSNAALPVDWREGGQGAPLTLQGAGLGLYSLRTLPLVGRDKDRDVLWGALGEVHAEGKARLVVIRGPSGVGKSRLAEWLCQRADELGAATPVKALHSPSPGPADGFARMISNAVGCTGLAPGPAARRVKDFLTAHEALDDYGLRAITRLVVTSYSIGEEEGEGLPTVRFTTAMERFAVATRVLEVVGRRRPVVVWLDDVQWGAEALGLVGFILKAQARLPCRLLFVLTARDEALVGRPIEWHMLTELMGLPGAQKLSLAPLAPTEHAALVERLLHLSGELAQAVKARTAGNPLFAIQLVGDWVQRGVLRVGVEGFELAEGERAALPDDLFALWSEHLDHLLGQHPAQDRLALELAAALGQEVDLAEWRAACHHGHLTLPEGAVEALMSERLIQRFEGGWGFVHGMLRETFERASREAGRWERHQLTCAAALSALYPTHQRGIFERIAGHLMAGGDLEPACAALLSAAHEHFDQSGFGQVAELLKVREEAFERLGLDPLDRRWGLGWALRAEAAINAGELEEAQRWIEALAEASPRGWPELEAQRLYLSARLSDQRGALDQADALARQALALHGALGDPEGEGRCLLVIGDVAWWRQSMSLCQQSYERALALFEQTENHPLIGKALYSLGFSFNKRGQPAQARAHFERGLQVADALGNRHLRAQILNGIAEAERAEGNLDSAEAHYREVARLLREVGSAREAQAQLNISLVLLQRGQYDEARRTLNAIEAEVKRISGPRTLAHLDAQLALCDAHDADRRAWDHRFASLSDHLAAAQAPDPDDAWCAARGGALWMDSSPDRARQSLLLARRQYAALGEDAEVAEVEIALNRLRADTAR